MGTAAAHHTMNTFLLLAAAGLAGAMAQSDSDYANYPEDDFQCPDELEGYFPHAYSCDKYWACVEGLAELRTCGNGLAFIDDEREEYKVEQCEELHLVECGARTQLEPAISSTSPDQVPECADYYADNPTAVQAAQISSRSQQPER